MCKDCDCLSFEDNPVIKKGKCPLCGEEMIEHIIKEGARFHVHRYSLCRDEFGEYAKVTCTTKDCEDNHGYGNCVPRTSKSMEEERKRLHRFEVGRKGRGKFLRMLMEE